jgi:hypothetical protein
MHSSSSKVTPAIEVVVDRALAAALSGPFLSIPFDIEAVLQERRICLADVGRWREGTFVPTGVPDNTHVMVRVSNVTAGRGVMLQDGLRAALRFEEWSSGNSEEG